MPRLQFTPWKEPAELLSVRSQFYPSTAATGEPADMRAKACSLVWVWKLRGNLPHTVEATALLTDAILHDDATKNSIFSIRATYSAAFCRFVTGLVDSKLYGKKQTMFQKAMELGLPASFVELRHEATHRELPSLIVLRNAAHQSLGWLWEFYWAGLDDAGIMDAGNDVPNESNGGLEFTKDAIRQTLKTLMSGENGLSESSGKRRSLRKVESSPELESIALVCSQQQEGAQAVAQVLLEQGFMILASRTIRSSIEPTFSTWDGVLKELCRHHTTFLTTLSGELARVLGDGDSPSLGDDPYKEAIYLWFDHILNSDTWSATRRLYFSTCYVDAVCHNETGYWTSRLRSLLDQYSSDLDTDVPMGTSRYGVSETRPNNDVFAGRKDGSPADMDTDSNLLRSYGWEVNGGWKYKPIGAV
ncbi:hypothetical protein AJ79_04980 [Helicocarpus griseus UAMH5409]|uniref:Cell morphogenesis protein Las1 n=1 Tax=Helicocarpus griseus UAMH5409 TaxID=1447875 RepID=A0A2B7XPZ6_9EURO|nr:hypothetical protein AJ79_04980 [Helicocarpus griseus UAMH5409]